MSPREALGRLIFFDGSLSEPSGQSCATCHEPERGYADRDGRAVSEGAVAGLFGNRNAMTIAYSCYVPPLHYDSTEATYVGGLFWDGRIATVEAQSCEPLLNPVEMGNSSAADVAAKIRRAPYYGELTRLYGEISNPDSLLGCVADALGAYERSREINRFSSKYDAWEQGLCALTDDEAAGLELFRGRGSAPNAISSIRTRRPVASCLPTTPTIISGFPATRTIRITVSRPVSTRTAPMPSIPDSGPS